MSLHKGFHCFADDSATIICGEHWESAKKSAEVALHSIKEWLDSSLLSLNAEKTKFLTCSLSTRTLPNFHTLLIINLDVG